MSLKLIKKGMCFVDYNPKKTCNTCWYGFRSTKTYCTYSNVIPKFEVTNESTCMKWREKDEAVSDGW